MVLRSMFFDVFYQTNLVFYPQPLEQKYSDTFANQQIEFNFDEFQLHGWLQESDSIAPFIFYYGGNAEEVSNKLHYFNKLGVTNYLLVNYRGYGLSEGNPNENFIKADALRQFDEITERLKIKPERIVLFGTSLGTGVAAYIASQRSVAKVVLNTPYDSVVNVGQRHYPFIPVKLLSHQRFESIKLAPQINVPMLCLIAEKDRVIPPQHADRLCSEWKGKVTKVTIPEAGHSNILGFRKTQAVIHDYLFK